LFEKKYQHVGKSHHFSSLENERRFRVFAIYIPIFMLASVEKPS